MSYYIHAGKFFLENKTENGGYLEVQDDGNFGLYYREDEKPSHGLIKEYGDQWIAPGYVDTHIHGLLDEDTMKSDWEGVNKISEGLLQAGVTSWLPTTITASDKELTELVKSLRHIRVKKLVLKFKDYTLKVHSLLLSMVGQKILSI